MPATKLEYNGSVKDGKITLPKRLRAEVVASFEGKQIRVVFERKKKVRTPSQNSYYWAVIVPMILGTKIFPIFTARKQVKLEEELTEAHQEVFECVQQERFHQKLHAQPLKRP